MNPSEVETIVREARNYVMPSDDLRPETLHIAEQLQLDRRTKIQLSCMVAIAGLALLVSMAIASHMSQWALPTRPSMSEIQTKAESISSDRTIGNHWALAETFNRIRSAQANPNLKMSDL